MRPGTRRARAAALAVLIVLLVLAGLDGGRAAAQEAPAFEVSASLQPRAATLGEHVQLVVTVRHSQELLISATTPTRVSNVELVATQPEELVFDDAATGTAGMATTTFRFTIAAYQLGDLHPGEVEVSWLARDGSVGFRTVQPPILRIAPVRAAGDVELRPLKPQATAGSPPAWWQRAELALAPLLLVVAVGAAVLWRRRRTVPAEVAEAPGVELPEDRARRRLDALQAATLDSREAYRQFYGELSIVVRAYLAARFGFNATALTTGELRERFDAAGIGRWQARLADGLLERCDAAVYARARPDPASADHDLTVAYEIVELSRPRRTEALEAVSA